MPRPTSKTELLELSQQNFDALLTLIDSLPGNGSEFEFPPGTMNSNARDIVAHLYHWHLMMGTWYNVGMSGQKPEMPAPGYSWKTTPDLNKVIWEKYQLDSLTRLIKLIKQSHATIMNLIGAHSDEELFTKKHYKWTGSTSLGAYLISATSSHYDWAIKLIKKAKKNS